jgi:hypothetical protein
MIKIITSVFFLELFFVAKVATITRNQRFAFIFGKNFRQIEKNKRKKLYYITIYPSAKKKNPPNFEKYFFKF